MARKHTEDEVLKSLSKKHDVKVIADCIQIISESVFDPKQNKYVDNKNFKGDIGNGTHGKIDFLVNHCGYYKIKVTEF